MKVNFSNQFQILAEKYHDREAVVHVERARRYTYSEFHILTNKIVNMLADSMKLQPGDCFISVLENDNTSLLHFPTIFKGSFTGGLTNYRDSLEQHIQQFDNAKPKVVFIENELIDTHYPVLHERGVKVICMDPVDRQRKDLYYFWDLVDGASKRNPNIELDDRDHVAMVRFTGGTTGTSKPAMYSMDNWFGLRDSFYALPDNDWGTGTRMLHMAPLSHGSGLMYPPTFYSGGCTITQNLPDLSLYCQTIEREGATHSLLVPTLLYRLLDYPAAQEFDLSSLRSMYYGAAPMSASKLKLLQEKFGNIFIQGYASTESLALGSSLSKASHQIRSAEDETRLASAGQITSSVELLIVDDAGEKVDAGQVGEFWIRSRGTCLGYLNSPEKTREEFTEDGYWKSGDLGYQDDAGFIYIVDRKKDMIITGGFNVYATDVENIVNSHEAVLMSAIVGVPDEDWGEAIHAEVVLSEGMELDEGELTKYLKDHLASYKVPKSIKFVEELPLSAAGKVLRRLVRDPYWARVGRKVG